MERWYNHRKSRRHACLKRALLSTVSFIKIFFSPPPPPPPPQSMLFVVEERLEGLKYNISLRGGGTQGEGIDNYVHYAKKGLFYENVSTLLSLITGYCSFYTKSELLQFSQWLLIN